jgi:hypothetical protein
VKDETAGGIAECENKVEHLKPLKTVQDIQEAWVADHAKHVGINGNLHEQAHIFKSVCKKNHS